MAEIEIGQLADRLSDEEVAQLAGALEELGAPTLPKADEGTAVSLGDVDDDIMSEFLDRLEAHDVAAEIYLPVEFDGRVEVAGLRVASAASLLDVLEELKVELDVAEAEEEEEDDDDVDYEDDTEILASQLRMCWKVLYDGASLAMDKHLPLHVSV